MLVRLEDHNLDSEVEDKVIEELNRLAPKAGAIIVSDFVYGVITNRVTKACKRVSANIICFYLVIYSAVAKWDL